MRVLTFVLLLVTINVSCSKELINSKDSIQVRKNKVTLDLIGNYLIGVDYARNIYYNDFLSLYASIGFGMHDIQPFKIQSISGVYFFSRKKLRPFISIGGELTFGDDQSKGYKSYQELQRNEKESGPPGTTYWYLDKSLNFISNIGLSYAFTKKFSIDVYYCLKYQNSYLGYSNYTFRNRVGLKVNLSF
jgi:hypothetical protein